MIKESLSEIKSVLGDGVQLVAVSKFRPVEDILEAYNCGQRDFAESRPQELFAKVNSDLPEDISWHFIGHLQTNKLKMVLPYVSLVQSVDSRHLLCEIEKWGKENSKTTDVLLEVHVGMEEAKQGFAEEEVLDILFDSEDFPHVRFRGLMGMASHTDDPETIEADFTRMDSLMAQAVEMFPQLEDFDQLSIGMSSDYKLALSHGSTIVRIGTAIFGERKTTNSL